MLDTILFVIFPYGAVLLAVAGSLYRYLANRFSYSSLSSQFLESENLFWGSTLWHYGVVPTLLIHLGGFTLPKVMALMHSTPELLYLTELIGKVLGLMAFAGVIVLIVRRVRTSRIRVVTSPMDWIVLALLFNQILLGLWTAFFYRWGAAWFIHTATPWVVSLATFHPQPETVSALPWVPKLHFLNATLLIAIFPFSRLVHMLTFPITYLWRRFQVVIWNRNKKYTGQ
jgi:nitrate reductase gamma subunit